MPVATASQLMLPQYSFDVAAAPMLIQQESCKLMRHTFVLLSGQLLLIMSTLSTNLLHI